MEVNVVKILVKQEEENAMRMARNIYRRKDGRFEGRYANGYNANGKTKYSSVFGKTYAEVKEKLERARADAPPVTLALSPTYSPVANRSTITGAVAAHLETSKLRLKPSTLGVYGRYLDNYIFPHFGPMRCDALTVEISQGFVNKLIENGLSVATVQSVFNLVKCSVEEANGSVFAVRFPKQAKKQVEYLSVEEQKRLEQAAKDRGSTDYIAVMLCLYTGIRIGEVSGLRWSDINFACKTFHVNRTMQRIRSNGESKTELAFLSPKSATSAREIPLPDFLLEILRDRERSAKTEYVLTYKNKPIEPRTLQYRFKRILEAAEVKDVCWHTTRHTFATRALENGFDVKSLSEILGHGSATVTLNKYAHASTEHKRGCMNALSAVYSTE
jgi:integrase